MGPGSDLGAARHAADGAGPHTLPVEVSLTGAIDGCPAVPQQAVGPVGLPERRGEATAVRDGRAHGQWWAGGGRDDGCRSGRYRAATTGGQRVVVLASEIARRQRRRWDR